MGFLDNLENSLKSLESVEERDSSVAAHRRAEERIRSLAVAPWAEQLKTSPFTQLLMEKAAVNGHRLRTKIYIAWIDTTLRLEAKGRKLDLEPSPSGIQANFIETDGTVTHRPVDLASDPQDLLKFWLG